MQKFDTTLTLKIQELSPSWRKHFRHMTLVGQPVFGLAVAAVIALYAEYVGYWQLFIAAIIVGIATVLASALKFVLRRKRPMTIYAASMRIKTYSFPSGHAAAGAACYGLVAYLCFIQGGLIMTTIAAIISLMIVSIGVSRVYLGAHFPSDIIGGWLLGGMGLALAIWLLQQ